MKSFKWPLYAVLLFACCVGLNRADTVAFLSSSRVSYLRKTLPQKLTSKGYSTLQAALLHKLPQGEVSQSDSNEVAKFLAVDDIFTRPQVLWTVDLFGANDKILAMTGDTQQSIQFVELVRNERSWEEPSMVEISTGCGATCLERRFGEIVKQLGGRYTKVKSKMKGTLHLPHCGMASTGLRLSGRDLSLWAMEMGTMQETLAKDQSQMTLQIHYRTTMVSLYWIRSKYGVESNEYRFVSCFTSAAITKLHQSLEQRFNGQVLTAILMHEAVAVVEENDAIHAAVSRHGRQLLDNIYSDTNPATTLLQKTKRFSTNSVAYVIFLILLATSLSAIYAMVNMDFTKDTLLYAQVKLD